MSKQAQERHTKRPVRHFVLLFIGAVLFFGCFWAVDWDLSSILEPAQREIAFERMSSLVMAFASPDTSSEFLSTAWHLTLETLAAAALATLGAAIFGYLLALGASRAVMVGDEGKRHWLIANFPLRSPTALVCSLCRLTLDALRAIPDFAWAVVMVAVVGLGPMAGALALMLNVTGILGKVYSELWDSVDPRKYEQVTALGGGRFKTFFYGIRPLASRSVQSFTLMRAECAIRNAAVIGAVGGGGLGSEISYRIGMGHWNKVTTIVIFTLGLTLTADMASNFVRRQLRNDPNHPRAPKASNIVWTLSRGWVGMGFVGVVILWATWYMGWGNHSGYEGTTKNHLKPLMEIFSGEAWTRLKIFKEMLVPRFDVKGFGEIALFSEYPPWMIFSGDAWASWHAELSKWFVWRVIASALTPVAMAIVGTVIGVIAAILLTYPHSVAFQIESSYFTGERTHPVIRAIRAVQFTLARGAGLLSRGVPEVLWAFLFIAFFGLGVVPGMMAIAVHTVGVLVRVFSETTDNVAYRRFEQSFMGSRAVCFGYVAAPICWKDWMTYAFFQFESNVRTGIVLGIVGIGGLGFFFKFNFDMFYYHNASTYLIVIVLITVVIDRTSRALKISRVSA